MSVARGAPVEPAGPSRSSYSILVKKLRIPLGFLLAFLYLAFARPKPLPFIVGGMIAFAGVIVRAWASGHIMKNDRLATSGPYAHTRNPLYFGSFLIGAGFAIAAHWALLLLVIAFWALVYGPTMEREKANIRGRFPEAYSDYEQNVPAFFPRPVPWKDGEQAGAPWSAALYMKHGEWKAALAYAAVILWLGARLLGWLPVWP